MQQIGQWLSDWKHGLVALGFALLALLAAVFVPDERWAKLGTLLSRLASDPAGAIALAGTVGMMLAAFRGAWQSGRDQRRESQRPPSPPSRTDGSAHVHALLWIVLASLFGLAGCALLLPGCGASALQQGAVGVTVALRAEEAVSSAVVADLERRMDACPAADGGSSVDVIAAHNDCVIRERASVADLTDALSAIELSIRAVGAGIATAAEVDAGQPIPAVLLDTLREVLSLWDRVEVALRAHGVDVPPEIDMVIAALSALVGPS
jgi:hypothetical protein